MRQPIVAAKGLKLQASRNGSHRHEDYNRRQRQSEPTICNLDSANTLLLFQYLVNAWFLYAVPKPIPDNALGVYQRHQKLATGTANCGSQTLAMRRTQRLRTAYSLYQTCSKPRDSHGNAIPSTRVVGLSKTTNDGLTVFPSGRLNFMPRIRPVRPATLIIAPLA